MNFKTKTKTKTLMPLAFAVGLTACSPFTDDPVNNNVGEGVAITESSGVLTAAITDVEGVDTAAGITYAWYLNGVLIQGETASSYTLQAGQSADDITVGVIYTDLAGTSEDFSSPVTTTPEPGTSSNQFASITDADTSDSGELRYKFPSGMSTGKASFTVTYPEGETERFYMTLFDTDTNNAGMIGELQMDEGKFYNRISGSSTAISAPDFTPGTPVSVVLKWDTAAASPTYTIEIDGTFSESFTAENAAEVTHLSLKLSSNSGTAANAVQVDDIAIYSDQAGTTEVFTDDFESYAVGHDLDASPYNSSTFSAVVGGTATAEPTTPTTPTTPAVNDNTGEGLALTEGGGVLTATITDAEGVDNASAVTYAWFLNDVLIQGETASSYTLQSGQTAAGITASVSYTDVAGTAEEFVSSEIVINDTGEGVAVTESGGVLTATITDSEGVDASAGVTYTWYLNGALIQGETASSYTLQSGEIADDVTVNVSYTDLAGTTEVFASPQTVTVPVVTINQYASITDMDASDSGELRYKFPAGMSTGKASFTVLYPAGEDETFYMTLFDTNTNNAGMIGELQMDDGKFKNRIGGSSTTIAGHEFTPGTPISVVLKWDTAAAAPTYTIEVDGIFSQSYAAENAAEVTHLSFKLSSNNGTADNAIQVDDLAIYSDQAGTTEVFADDFDSYAVGHDLDASPYNSSTFSAVVAADVPALPNQVASITDMDPTVNDAGELRYKFPDGQTAGKISLSVFYPAGEVETFYMTLFDTDTNNAGMIGELQMDEGKFKNRVGGSTTTISEATFTEGTPVSVVLKWDTSNASASYYTFEIDGQVLTYTAENLGAPVTHFSMKLSSNSGTAANAIEVDDLAIYSDEAGTVEVFSDDFESYTVGHDLDASPYNSSTYSAFVVPSSN